MSHISTRSLQKFIATQKSFSKTPPKLWPKLKNNNPLDDKGVPILKLTHPILYKLDTHNVSVKNFKQVQTQLTISGLFQHSLAFSRVVKKLCSLPNGVDYAVELFDHFEKPDAFICNTIIRCFVNLNDPLSGLDFYYEKMIGRFVWPNHYSFPIIVKVCAELGCVKEGEKVHGRIVKHGFEFDLFVRNAMIHMYFVCGRVRDAKKVFDMCCVLDVVSWNSMIDGYVKNGEVGLARWLFDEMPERDLFSWNSMISGYVGVGDMERAKELFDEMPCRDLVSWNCLIDGFARVGNVVAAIECFDRLAVRNVVSWNTVLALYVRVKKYGECLRLFDRMIAEGDVRPNEASVMSVLTACAHLTELDRGKWIHSYIKRDKNIKADVLLSTALLTMYSKCGAMELAKDVFDKMPDKNVVSWNSMIMGYGMHGDGEKALQMFMEMEKSGQMPNDATFVCLLSACTHAGMILEGWWYFDIMHRVYKIEPKIEHYGCMVDLLGRAGLLRDSEEVIKTMPMEAGPAFWGALLSACRSHSNVELGEVVAKRLIDLEPEDIGPYVLLSNIYAAEGRWDDVDKVRRSMVEKGFQKAAGSSVFQVADLGGESFQVKGSVHKRSMVYSMLSDMGTQIKMSRYSN
ncbi:Pentatricopeptide repeat-containing protein [Heracleum sosnowskyi]|uniref:Pentatricopeptide repeat-containing protein n=1 Tax=Heracleum sosnowskyi TaxID=360622 RepID=A0AAD8HWS1_9APIA|nr:Pentatricopeptide repeat-containing protein [Heracleum sosnowskyi]